MGFMDLRLQKEIDELLYLMLENAASAEQVERMNSLLASSTENQQYAADYYFITAALRKTNAIPSASLGTQNEVNEQYNLLLDLAREERIAPVLDIETLYDNPEFPGKKVQVSKAVGKVNRLSVGIAIASLAALLLMLAYVRTVPPRESVAVLVDSINPRWQNSQEDIQAGFLFYNTDVPRTLKDGMLEIEFDYGATVVIEGPCEFTCKSDNQLFLNYGRVYARVPQQATGFTVETSNARIVDMGTEFGVRVNVDRSTELHVMKGYTTLVAGKKKDKEAFAVLQGQAREVNPDGDSVKEVPLEENAFVQQINSKTGLVRKGQKSIDLADILGGGNGFGTGHPNLSIDPVSGDTQLVIESNRVADNTYRPISGNPFIDGIFVPNGEKKQVVSSAGHIFGECPETRGNYYTGLIHTPVRIDNAEIVLGNVNYSQSESTCLFLHANLGVTYDLSAIRAQLSDVKINRFQSTIGISDSSPRECNADFWVLIDGAVRYRKVNVREKGVIDFVDIPLSEQDRFLTLVATDGGDPNIRLAGSSSIEQSMDSDWCVFGAPVLVLEK